MKKRLEEIERNMSSILEDVNKTFNDKYLSLEIEFWPTHSKSLQIDLWDGKNHAPLRKDTYCGTPEELLKWFILHQKFNKVL